MTDSTTDTQAEAQQAEAQPRRLTIQDILATDDLPERDVFIEQWGGVVRIKALSRATVQGAYQRATDRKTGEIDAEAAVKLLVIWASVDPKISPSAYDELQKKNSGAIKTIIDAVFGLAGLDEEALKRAQSSFRD